MASYLKGRDPDRMQRDIRSLAGRDGGAGYPAMSADGSAVTPYLGDALNGQGRSAVAAGVADRLVRRGDDTEAIKVAVGELLASTVVVAAAREAADRAKHAQVALENRWGTADREKPFLRTMALPLVVLMATAGALNLFGALSEVTDDDMWVTGPLSLGIGLAIVFTGAAVARLFKRWELDSRETGRFVGASRIVPFVAAVGFTGMLLVPLGVAVVRSTGHEASALRSANDSAGGIDIVLPGETAPAADPAATSSEVPTIPTWTWVLFEAAMVMAAFSVEYLAYSPTYERLRDAIADAAEALRIWVKQRTALGATVAAASTALERRAERDLATAAQGESTAEFFTAMWDWYRDRNGAARSAVIGDPWRGHPTVHTIETNAGDASMSIAAKEPIDADTTTVETQVSAMAAFDWFLDHSGHDMSRLDPAGAATGTNGIDPKVIDVYGHAMKAAVDELDRGLTAVALTPVTFDPAANLDAELGEASTDPGPPPPLPDTDGHRGTGEAGELL